MMFLLISLYVLSKSFKLSFKMFNVLSFFSVLLAVVLMPSRATTQRAILRIGGVVDYTSRVGKEQKVAMEIAVQHISHSTSTTTARLDLQLQDTRPNSTSPAAAG